MTGKSRVEGRIEREARLRWVPLAHMRVNPLAQRDLNQARVAKLAAAHAMIRTRSARAGLPARAKPSASSEKIAIPTSSASASTQLAALWCLAWNTYRYWASRLTANKPTPSTNSSPVATATRTLPGLWPLPRRRSRG